MKIHLKEIPTHPPEDISKEDALEETGNIVAQLSELQKMLYAQSRHSILIVLQGVDASGKNSTIRHAFAGFNPMGCTVKSWKVPTEEEAAHDFLWRIHQQAPQKGMISIFNRSHYEDVIVPFTRKSISDRQLENRIDHINNFEQLLMEENNTLIFKFYLHLSKEKQREKLQKRLDDPSKRWKHDPADQFTQDNWSDFREIYERIFERTSDVCNWEIVAADKKWFRNYVVAQKVLEGMQSLNLSYPTE